MAKRQRQPRITAGELCWDMTDKEIIDFAFELLRKRYSQTPLEEIVLNRIEDVQNNLTSSTPDRRSFPR
jgi:hypothetical protein